MTGSSVRLGDAIRAAQNGDVLAPVDVVVPSGPKAGIGAGPRHRSDAWNARVASPCMARYRGRLRSPNDLQVGSLVPHVA